MSLNVPKATELHLSHLTLASFHAPNAKRLEFCRVSYTPSTIDLAKATSIKFDGLVFKGDEPCSIINAPSAEFIYINDSNITEIFAPKAKNISTNIEKL